MTTALHAQPVSAARLGLLASVAAGCLAAAAGLSTGAGQAVTADPVPPWCSTALSWASFVLVVMGATVLGSLVGLLVVGRGPAIGRARPVLVLGGAALLAGFVVELVMPGAGAEAAALLSALAVSCQVVGAVLLGMGLVQSAGSAPAVGQQRSVDDVPVSREPTPSR